MVVVQLWPPIWFLLLSLPQGYAQARAQSDGRVFVAPYDDPYVIAGQGTIGNEILRCVMGWLGG